MRKIIVTAALLAATQAFGQSQFYYDQSGRQLGYSVPTGNGGAMYYGSGGQQLGNTIPIPGTGTTNVYGPNGQSRGYVIDTGGYR